MSSCLCRTAISNAMFPEIPVWHADLVQTVFCLVHFYAMHPSPLWLSTLLLIIQFQQAPPDMVLIFSLQRSKPRWPALSLYSLFAFPCPWPFNRVCYLLFIISLSIQKSKTTYSLRRLWLKADFPIQDYSNCKLKIFKHSWHSLTKLRRHGMQSCFPWS